MSTIIDTMIVDDSKKSIDLLENDLSQYNDIHVVYTTTDIKEAEKFIYKSKPQLLFIDIEMPGKNGLEFIEDLNRNIDFKILVVFYSAFEKYLINVLRLSAFDFLQKPYFPEELDNIIERVRDAFNNTEEEHVTEIKFKDLIGMQTNTGLDILNSKDIVLFQYNSIVRTWQMLYHDNKQYKLKMNLKAKDILNINPSFVQISQNCILNLNYLNSIENKKLKCILIEPFSDVELYVSRTYYSKLKERLNII